jgi:hypothetical protein
VGATSPPLAGGARAPMLSLDTTDDEVSPSTSGASDLGEEAELQCADGSRFE